MHGEQLLQQLKSQSAAAMAGTSCFSVRWVVGQALRLHAVSLLFGRLLCHHAASRPLRYWVLGGKSHSVLVAEDSEGLEKSKGVPPKSWRIFRVKGIAAWAGAICQLLGSRLDWLMCRWAERSELSATARVPICLCGDQVHLGWCYRVAA